MRGFPVDQQPKVLGRLQLAVQHAFCNTAVVEDPNVEEVRSGWKEWTIPVRTNAP